MTISVQLKVKYTQFWRQAHAAIRDTLHVQLTEFC